MIVCSIRLCVTPNYHRCCLSLHLRHGNVSVVVIGIFVIFVVFVVAVIIITASFYVVISFIPKDDNSISCA